MKLVGLIRRSWRALLVVGGCLALVAALGACGSSGSGSSGGSSTSSDSASTGSRCDLAYAQGQLDKYKQVPAFQAPGPAFDASRARGKVIYDIPLTSSIPFVNAIDQSMADVAKRQGIKLVVYPNQGQTSQWVQGMQTAIAAHADAIVLNIADPRVLRPQIAAARAAGIPVISTHLYDDRYDQPGLPGSHYVNGVTTMVGAPFDLAARLEADDAIATTRCNAHVIAIQSSELENFSIIVRSWRDELARYCPSCTLDVINVPVADWSSRLQSNLQAELQKQPDTNWVIPFADGMTQYAVPAIVASGKTGKVQMSTFNGTPFALKYVQDADIVHSNLGENLDLLGYSYMDQAMRVLLGLRPNRHGYIPVRLFDDSNVNDTGNPPVFSKGFGDAYVSGFEKLWRNQ
ncbi:MAG TPA: sugar ABC transporter substrate-binding protein [Conexibacter sp.]|nr:sugar ABC transporter substrate-binding protein [Conexibacter sp.]